MEQTLRWRHNEHDDVSNHQPHDCFFKLLFRRRSKETSKLRVTGHCAGNSPVTGHKGPLTRKMFPFYDVTMIRRAPNLSGIYISAQTSHEPTRFANCEAATAWYGQTKEWMVVIVNCGQTVSERDNCIYQYVSWPEGDGQYLRFRKNKKKNR